MPDERWHVYKDDPPKEMGKYFVAIDMGGLKGFPNKIVDISFYTPNLEEYDDEDFGGIDHAGWFNYSQEYGNYERTRVTHWMELPSTEGLE